MPASRTLTLPTATLARIRRYHELLKEGHFLESSIAKSDYWKEHSSRAQIEFLPDGVRIAGESGFYIPPPAGSVRPALRDWVQRTYKSLVLGVDRALRLSASHSLSTLLTYDLAYDYIVRCHPSIDYDDNPYCFDPSRLRPLFGSSKELRAKWFLHDRYQADAQIYRAALYHAMFAHFIKGEPSRYLEIGAGSGNLASFFKQYNGSRVVIVDLPEVILFSACFLLSVFPETTFTLPNEVDGLSSGLIDKADFTFLTTSQAKELPESSFDIAVNTASLQEMTHPQIQEYIQLIQKVCRHGALWCNVNRIEKFPSKTERPIRAGDFPYLPGNEVLVDQVDRFSRFVQPDGSIMRIERIRKSNA